MSVVSPKFWSPTDLVNFVACTHLSALEREVAAGSRARPERTAEDELVSRKGDEHERMQLAELEAQNVAVTVVAYPRTLAEREAAARATHAAMRAGAAWIHNATFVDGNFIGTADFLRRVERPSALGAWSYEVVDAKLSASAKPAAILQLCSYSDRLTYLQDLEPREMHLILGDGHFESFAYADFSAYYRLTRDRFLNSLAVDEPTYPEPVVFCERCRWNADCARERRKDDHLSLVANIRRRQIEALAQGGITTLAALGESEPDVRVPKLAPKTLERLRLQADYQLRERRSGVRETGYLAYDAGTGFDLLPAPDFGDLYFDMEGDPFFEGGGLEYLFGVSFRDDEGTPDFRAFWGHDRPGELRALEAFVDFVSARRARFPHMHVYHYAPYETSAVSRLVQRYSTCEMELDELLRARVFVDLYKVVRQALVISAENYSIKSVERLYRPKRSSDVTTSIGSVVAYETWRETHDPAVLEEIRIYNRDDCDSTMELHAWLLERRVGAPAHTPEALAAQPNVTEMSEKARAENADTDALRGALGADAETAPDDDGGRWLLGTILDYHRREARPEYRAHFERMEATLDELIDDPEAFAGCRWDNVAPTLDKQSEVYTLTAPPQESKLRPGKKILDRATGKAYGLVELDPARGFIRVKRGKARRDDPLPEAFISEGPISTGPMRRALREVARAAVYGESRFRAVRDIMERARPRLQHGVAFAAPDGLSIERIAQLALQLDESYLFIQGPPGSGKTYTGARVAVALMRAGKRVGVTARSHKAIHHLLHGIEDAAREANVTFRGLVKCKAEEDEAYESRTGAIEGCDALPELVPGDGIALVAGTTWAMSAEGLSERLDVLIVDEAGQMALADAVAAGSAARSIVLLGDPQQLAHVSQAIHPPASGESVLVHLLDGRRTVAGDRGVFLPRSYRMHPRICDFISTLMYDGRLHADVRCEQQALLGDHSIWSGAGLRAIDVAHDGNIRQSPEEAAAICDAIADLIGRRHIDCKGRERTLEQRDILVVAPYNAQVRCIASALDQRGFSDIPVGTVDRFQGQEAPVVFFSLTASSGDDVPRGIDFLFSRNRLNVAISRAATLAVLVSSPRLLTLRATSVEDLKLVNAVASFRERATFGDSALV